MKLLRILHRWYKFALSPLLGERCRFFPPCSDYALEACERYGVQRGLWLGMKRLIRCQPFCQGGIDPLPGVEPEESNSGNSLPSKAA